MTIGIVIPTYQRGDGTSPSLLTRALNSIKNQTYSDYKVFLIGDKYDDADEFKQLATTIIDSDKIYYKNLPVAVEREKYRIGSRELWCSGGVSATNFGIETAILEGIGYICHLDHDDYWHIEHLETVNNVIESTNSSIAFVYTCGTYFSHHLPNVILNKDLVKSLPEPCKTIHSSTCINFLLIPLRYRDVKEVEGRVTEADADMWGRISKYITDHNLNSYLVCSLTCFHPTERT